MGEHAEMRLDGTLCEGCGVFLNDNPPGFPCYCNDCRHDGCNAFEQYVSIPVGVKVICPTCHKRVKSGGYWQHRRDKHGD